MEAPPWHPFFCFLFYFDICNKHNFSGVHLGLGVTCKFKFVEVRFPPGLFPPPPPQKKKKKKKKKNNNNNNNKNKNNFSNKTLLEYWFIWNTGQTDSVF